MRTRPWPSCTPCACGLPKSQNELPKKVLIDPDDPLHQQMAAMSYRDRTDLLLSLPKRQTPMARDPWADPVAQPYKPERSNEEYANEVEAQIRKDHPALTDEQIQGIMQTV